MTNGPVIEEQLAESFRTAMERGRIALFSAPCGFGKTVVARALLAGCRVRELSADGETLDLPADDGTWDVLLLDELQSLPESGQEPLCALLRTAVERRFVLLSRGGLPGWLAPFQFSGLLRVFIADDLALHRVGAAELLARCGVTLPDTELTAVLRDTCGHPLALELLGRCMAARREGYTPVVEQTVRRQMMAYFEDAVYRRFDLPLRRFLLELAPLEPFDLELARIATGDSRAGEHLAWLQQQTSMLLYGGGQVPVLAGFPPVPAVGAGAGVQRRTPPQPIQPGRAVLRAASGLRTGALLLRPRRRSGQGVGAAAPQRRAAPRHGTL